VCLASDNLAQSRDEATGASPPTPTFTACTWVMLCQKYLVQTERLANTLPNAGIKGSAERPRWGARTTPAEAQATRKGSLSSNGSSPVPTTPPRRRTAGDAAGDLCPPSCCCLDWRTAVFELLHCVFVLAACIDGQSTDQRRLQQGCLGMKHGGFVSGGHQASACTCVYLAAHHFACCRHRRLGVGRAELHARAAAHAQLHAGHEQLQVQSVFDPSCPPQQPQRGALFSFAALSAACRRHVRPSFRTRLAFLPVQSSRPWPALHSLSSYAAREASSLRISYRSALVHMLICTCFVCRVAAHTA
jgi:hypothetical protein